MIFPGRKLGNIFVGKLMLEMGHTYKKYAY